MGSQQRSTLMADKKTTRGSAVSGGLEEPTNRAELLIVLKNETTGETVIWGREDNPAEKSVPWFATLLRWGLGG
jgi:hypothetical protein